MIQFKHFIRNKLATPICLCKGLLYGFLFGVYNLELSVFLFDLCVRLDWVLTCDART